MESNGKCTKSRSKRTPYWEHRKRQTDCRWSVAKWTVEKTEREEWRIWRRFHPENPLPKFWQESSMQQMRPANLQSEYLQWKGELRYLQGLWHLWWKCCTYCGFRVVAGLRNWKGLRRECTWIVSAIRSRNKSWSNAHQWTVPEQGSSFMTSRLFKVSVHLDPGWCPL